jgi:hypothetical protein
MIRLAERVQKLREVTGASTNCGWMVDEVASFLYALVKFYKPDLTIQIGHLWGKSALFVLEALADGFGQFEDQCHNPDKPFLAYIDAHRPQAVSPLFMSVDPVPQGYVNGPLGIALLNEWYPNIFRFFGMKSQDFFAEHGHSISNQYAGKSIMTIVDGDHSEEGCLNDLIRSYTVGSQVIFLDDIDLGSQIKQAADRFAETYGYHYAPLHVYNGVGIFVK